MKCNELSIKKYLNNHTVEHPVALEQIYSILLLNLHMSSNSICEKHYNVMFPVTVYFDPPHLHY